MKTHYYRVSFLIQEKINNDIIEERIIESGFSHTKPAVKKYDYFLDKFKKMGTIKGTTPRLLIDPKLKYSIAILEISVFKSFKYGSTSKKISEIIDKIVSQTYLSKK
jgi:hypothetical protein